MSPFEQISGEKEILILNIKEPYKIYDTKIKNIESPMKEEWAPYNIIKMNHNFNKIYIITN